MNQPGRVAIVTRAATGKRLHSLLFYLNTATDPNTILHAVK
jgi:hypothetical protein